MRINKTKLGKNRNNIAIFCFRKIFFVHYARNFQNTLVKNAKIGYNKMIIDILIHEYEDVYGKQRENAKNSKFLDHRTY